MIPLDQLTRSSGPLSEGATLDRPLDHLVACHRRIEQRLEILERAGAHLDGSRREEALGAVAAALRFFDSNGTWHTADEEQSLFPRLRPKLTAEEMEYIGQLEQQHQQAEALYGELKMALEAGTHDGYRQIVARLCEIYRAHIASEDQTLVSLGGRLSEAELAEISAEMKKRRGLANLQL